MEKGPVELGSDEEEGESESKVINQIFGRLQFPKNEVRYLENIFLRLYKRFLPIRQVMKANIIAYIKTKFLRPVLSVKKHPLGVFRVLHPLKLI